MSPVVSAAAVLLGGRICQDAWVAIEAGRIAGVGSGSPPTKPKWCLRSGVLAPGLVDAQVNGAFGVDLVDADETAWRRVRAGLPEYGTSAFVPTFTSAPVEELAAALRDARPRADEHEQTGTQPTARVLGIHVEGPFLSEDFRGAHPAEVLCDPSAESVDRLLEAGQGVLTYVTLAPERQWAIEAVDRFSSAGVRVALGHSGASDVEVAAAVQAGASLVTHLFNAQRPFHHRNPGIVGAALTDERLTVGLIADLVHVAPTGILVAFAAATGRLMLVSDATSALGMPDGSYVLGGASVTLAGGQPPTRSDGTLAGSALRLDDAVGNAIRLGIRPVVALEAASRVPAVALGRPDLGRIAPGLPADMVWLGPDWRTLATWVGGQLAFVSPASGF